MQIELKNMAWMNLSRPTPVTLTTLPSLRWYNALLWITDLMIPILAWQVYSLVYGNLNIMAFFVKWHILYLDVRSSFLCYRAPLTMINVFLISWVENFSYQRKKTEREEVIGRDDPIPQPPYLSFPLFSCHMRNIPKRVVKFGICLRRTCKNRLGFLDFEISLLPHPRG